MDLLITLFRLCPMKDCPRRYAVVAFVVGVVVGYLIPIIRKRLSSGDMGRTGGA